MEWFKTRGSLKYDLCSSGVESLTLADLDLKLDELELSGENFYGYPPLLETIAARFGVDEQSVVSTQGTSHALFLVCAALLVPGDGVLVEKPAYESLYAVPEAFEASVARVGRRFENGFQLQLEQLEASILPDTKLVIVSNLHNPSGTQLPDSVIKSAARIASDKGAMLLVDEIYRDFSGETEIPSARNLADNIIAISSMTKVYGLGDLRCGWILASPELVERIRRIIDYINVEGVYIGERISTVLFGKLDEIRKRSSQWIAVNRKAVNDFIESEEKLSWVEPAGGVVCFPRLEAGITGDELALRLRDGYDTGVVPGSFFQENAHFRIGFGGNHDLLTAGLDNIRKALKVI